MASIYDEQCATYPSTPPRADDERYPPPEATGKAGLDGYTIVARRPFGAGDTGWMKPAQADDYERMMNEYPMGDSGIGIGGGGYSDY